MITFCVFDMVLIVIMKKIISTGNNEPETAIKISSNRGYLKPGGTL